MKIKSLVVVVVVLAMLMAALSLGVGSPPCVGGTYQGSYTIRTCENPTQCSFFLTFNTFDQTCDLWCCPDSSMPVYNNCQSRVSNGCCRERTDLGPPFPYPQIIYGDNQTRVVCQSGTE